MRKHLSLFLCVCMLSVLLPAAIATGAESSAAAEAFLTPRGGGNLDGSFQTENWYLVHELKPESGTAAPSGKLGATWTADALSLALSYQDAETLTVTLGSASVVYDLSGKQFTQNAVGAAAAVGADGIELRLPFAACGVTLTKFNQDVPFQAILENSAGRAALAEPGGITLRGSEIIWADDCDDFAAAGYSTGVALIEANKVTRGDAPGGIGAYRFELKNPDKNGIIDSISKSSSYSGGPIDYTMDIDFRELPIIGSNFGWRGFAMQIRTTDKLYGFGFNKDAEGKIYCGVITSGSASENADTGLTLNSGKHTIKLSFDSAGIASLFVDGVKKHTYAPANCANTSAFNTLQIFTANYNGVGVAQSADLDLYNYSITRPLYENPKNVLDTSFESLTFDDIKGDNIDADSVGNDLRLPETLTIPVINAQIPLVWSSSNTDIIADDGTLNTNLMSGGVTMTASATLDGVTATKDIHMNVVFNDPNGTVGHIKNDMNPYTGVFADFSVNEVIALDKDYSSIGIDLKSVQTVNRVILTDGDDVSRVEKRDLSLYVSNDNKEYTRIKDWDFLKMGSKYYLYNFETNARYVKVHCHYDSLEYISPEEKVSFIGPRQSMIRAEAIGEDDFLGANGGSFTGCKQYRVKNTEGKELYDYAMYIPTEDLMLPEGQYQADMSDIRFTLSGGAKAMLHHYYDGNGFFVRIPYIEAGGSRSIRVYYGNPQAVSTASGTGTFEVEYGNKTIQDMTAAPTFVANAKVCQMPNGDLISMGNSIAAADVYVHMRRSTDGGRTWGEPKVVDAMVNDPVPLPDPVPGGNAPRNEGGSFIKDGSRVFYVYFRYGNYDTDYATPGGLQRSDCKIAIICTDDNGYTWSQPYHVENPPDRPYTLSYSNGLVTSVKDGDGPNVDYVVPYGMRYNDSGAFATSAIYSKDGGATWQHSENVVYLEAEGMEGGVSESAVAELSDGRLIMLMRCQFNGVFNFYKTYSDDFGVTWEATPVPTNIFATNTLPVLAKDRGNIMLLWSGHSTQGSASYQRYPMALAYSDDDAETWKQHLDVLANTSWSHADVTPGDDFITQPDITYSNYKGADDAMLMWWRQGWSNPNLNRGMLIEDFHDYLYKTQGAYDSFEGSNSKNEGWLNAQLEGRGQEILSGADKVEVSGEAAAEGKQSLKLQDVSGAKICGSRNIPSMTKGTISFKVKLSPGMTKGLHVEMKAAYGIVGYLKNAPLVIYIAPNDGTANSGLIGLRQEGGGFAFPGKKLSYDYDGWYHFRLEFDMEETKKAKLYLDDEFLTEVAIDMTQGNYISNIQFSDEDKTVGDASGNYFYVDELIATKTIRDERKLMLAGEYAVHYDNTTKTLSAAAEAGIDATAVVASYNGQTLLDVTTINMTFTSSEPQVVSVSDLKTSGATHIKAMLLSGLDTAMPLCGSEKTSLVE